MPPKIQIRGASGSGKSTLGPRVAAALGVPYIELDALHHIGPNWTEATGEELERSVRRELDGLEGWVVDGNYGRKIGELVSEQADTIVWLDPPLAVILWRLFARTRSRIRSREVLWGGNMERWRTALVGRESLFVWAVRRHRSMRRSLPRSYPGRLVRLRSSREAERWLASLTEP